MFLSSEPDLVDYVGGEGGHVVGGYREGGDHRGEGFDGVEAGGCEVDVVLFVSVEDEGEILGEGGGGQMCGAFVWVCRSGGSGGMGLSCEVDDLFVVIFFVVDGDASSSFAG